MILSFLRLPSGCQELEVEHPALSLFSLLPLSTSSFSPGFSATWFLCWREGERDRTGLRRSNPSSHACTMRFALTGNQDLGISSLTLRVGSQHFAGGHSGKLDMQEEPGSGEGERMLGLKEDRGRKIGEGDWEAPRRELPHPHPTPTPTPVTGHEPQALPLHQASNPTSSGSALCSHRMQALFQDPSEDFS